MSTLTEKKEALAEVFGHEWKAKNDVEGGFNHKQPWTTEDKVLLVKMAFAGVTPVKLAEYFGRSSYSVELVLGGIAIKLLG